jgi:hypothetical protein
MRNLWEMKLETRLPGFLGRRFFGVLAQGVEIGVGVPRRES